METQPTLGDEPENTQRQPDEKKARVKTLAIRLDEELHARLSAIAQLMGSTITDEIRQAIEAHLESKRQSSELSQRAESLLEDIEREADARKAAIAELFGDEGTNPNEPAEPKPSSRRGGSKGSSRRKASDS